MVTGASSGLGEALAAELALRGAHVALVARSTDKLKAVTARLPGAVHADGAMGLVIPPEQLHVFDAASGKRIEAGG